MYRMGKQPFAGAAFSLDQNVTIYRRDFLDQFKDFLHFLTNTNEVMTTRNLL
jgi:hypothetical protein